MAKWAIPYVIITVLVMSLATFHTRQYPKLSPVDEQAHVDYLLKVRDGHIPRLNELMGQDALDEEACRGFYSGYVPPPCLYGEGTYDPATFQYGGISAAVQHPPIYYAVTALIAYPISVMPGIESFVTAGRIATAVWLAGALCLLWGVMRSFGAPRTVSCAVLVMLACTSQVLLSSTTINPDATALFAGSLMLLAALRLRERPGLLLALSAIVVWLKATNILVVLAASLLVLILEWSSPRLGEQRSWAMRIVLRFRLPVAMTAIGGLAGLVWTLIIGFRALPEPENLAEIAGQPATFWTVVLQFFPPTSNAAYEPFFVPDQAYLLTAITFFAYLLVSSAAGSALMLPFRDMAARIGWVALAGMLLGPPIVMVLIKAGTDVAYAPPTRYGISLLPFIAAPLMLKARSVPARVLISALGITVAIVTVLAISDGVPPPPPPPPAAPAA